MITKCKIKQISSLKEKKYREKENLFVIEGIKSINEYLLAYPGSLFELYSEKDAEALLLKTDRNKIITTGRAEMKLISRQSTPCGALALCRLPQKRELVLRPEKLYLALDGLRDPGNMGTVIRLCDWFGVDEIIASKDTADCFNPKVVQASMSSLARVYVHYVDLPSTLERCNMPVYGAFLDGENIYGAKLGGEGIIVVGNESNGISREVEKLTSHKITIPKFDRNGSVESLNAAMASAVILSQFRARL